MQEEGKEEMTALLIPLLFLAVFVYALFKKVKLYDSFLDGVKEALPLVLSLFPYLAVVLMLSELFTRSGLSDMLASSMAPLFRALGVPPELSTLVLVKPFSGSASTALLSELYAAYGADSYIGRCASVAYGSSETVFYISAVYFAGSPKRRLLPALAALLANFLAVVAGCFLCRWL